MVAGGASVAPADIPPSMQAWEQRWAAERAATVEKINANGWGLSADEALLTGPEGFTVDLASCPDGWSNTAGLSDTEIKLGGHTPLSGAPADIGQISRGAEAILTHYSSKGLFTDKGGQVRRVVPNFKDDGNDASRAASAVEDLLTDDEVFALWGVGAPGVLATYRDINRRCVPHPLAVSAHPAWGDPINHPWTTGSQLATSSEARLWASFIADRYDALKGPDGKVTVAALVLNDDLGRTYDAAFRSWHTNSPQRNDISYITETVETSATLSNAIETLASARPAVFIVMATGGWCRTAIAEAPSTGLSESAKFLFLPSLCGSPSIVGADVVSDRADGWWIMRGGEADPNTATPARALIDWVATDVEEPTADPDRSVMWTRGIYIGWAWAQALAIAGQLEGGLNRTNLILALRSMDMTHPGYLDGINFNLNGSRDSYFVEGSDASRYDATTRTWIQQGDVIDLSGQTPHCAWDPASGRCA